MRLFYIGYPSDIGGANTEAWHTIRLWREGGLEVHAIPTWRTTTPWRKRLDEIGVITHSIAKADLSDYVPLQNAICVSFCNEHFLEIAPTLQALDCRLVWLNCMTWLFEQERRLYDRYGSFDAYVYQSEFQRMMLEGELRPFGYEPSQGYVIRGAFCTDDWPCCPQPHNGSGRFVVGQLARPDPDKWHAEMWKVYEQIDYPLREARVMGWNGKIEWKCGAPPSWATCLRPQSQKTQDFFGSLHCLLTLNGGARENWPRIGLEAMAAGVPIVTENKWGWREMIIHGETGFLGNTPQELAGYATCLAKHPKTRMRIIQAARRHLSDLCDPQLLYKSWSRLLSSLGA